MKLRSVAAGVIVAAALGFAAIFTAACGTTRDGVRERSRHPNLAMSPSAYEHYIRARMAGEAGDHGLAVVELRMAMATAGERAELLVAIGEELFATGQLAAARLEAEAAIRAWPDDGPAWRLVGRVRAAQAEVSLAAPAFERSLALETDEDTFLMLAATYRQIGDEARALATYERLVREMPSSAEGHFRLGRALATKQPAVAEAELRRAIERDPDHIDARVALADVLRRGDKITEARTVLRVAFDRSGADASVGERLFHTLLELGDKAAAADLLRRVDGGNRAAHVRVRLGQYFLQLRLPDDALRIAQALLAHDAGEQSARVLAARALAQLGRVAEAVASCRAVPPEALAYVEARAFAGDLLGKSGAPHEGLLLVTQAMTAWPDEPALIAVAATLHEELGAMDRARALLDAALTKAPLDEALIYARASLEERAKDPDRAVAIMKRLLDRDGDSVIALNFIGYSYAQRNIELDASERLLRHAHELRPDDAFVLDSLGWLHLRRGHVEQARAALERAGRLAPFEPEILFHLGELSLRGGEDGRARELFREALGLTPAAQLRTELEERLRTLEAKAP